VQKSAGKSVSIFWDQDGIILTGYLPKGQTINAEYYSSLLVQLKGIFKKNAAPREGQQGCVVLVRQCSGSPGTCNHKKLVYLSFQCLDHPPYSPDLAPSEYH
jgi:histone-lysine N-methyltransferase SETMAR